MINKAHNYKYNHWYKPFFAPYKSDNLTRRCHRILPNQQWLRPNKPLAISQLFHCRNNPHERHTRRPHC